AAVEQVFTLPEEQRFDRLNEILLTFGHFVPTGLIIGGRLYSTESKKIEDSSSIDNVLTKHAAEFKLAISTYTTDVGVEAKLQSEISEKTAEQQKKEAQRLQLKAVGGEGAFVNNTDKWVLSLSKATGWALVKFDNLVPSINLLPAALFQKCDSLLKELASKSGVSVESLQEKNAHFLFYNGYHEKYGRHITPRYVSIKSTGSENNVLTVIKHPKSNDAEVALKPYEDSVSQQWWISPDGKIVSRNDKDEQDIYVLSMHNDQLVINQNGYFDNQFWSFGGGLLKNDAKNKYIVLRDKDTVDIKDLNDARNSRSAWLALTQEQLLTLRE
ncbi:MAG: hypothetical protein V4616_11535, partial [Bacteroidota bacterium]